MVDVLNSEDIVDTEIDASAKEISDSATGFSGEEPEYPITINRRIAHRLLLRVPLERSEYNIEARIGTLVSALGGLSLAVSVKQLSQEGNSPEAWVQLASSVGAITGGAYLMWQGARFGQFYHHVLKHIVTPLTIYKEQIQEISEQLIEGYVIQETNRSSMEKIAAQRAEQRIARRHARKI